MTRSFVLDTSVLLSDPGALGRFGEHEVILPLVVISELEGKRHHPELGWFARQTLRVLDELRITYGRLDAPVAIGDEGGTLHVELNHSDLSTLPADLKRDIRQAFMDAPTKDKAAFDRLSDGKNREFVAVTHKDYQDIVEMIQFVNELRKKAGHGEG